LSNAVFSWLHQPGAKAVTSTLTMTELLVQPYRLYDEERIDELYAQLSIVPNLEWVPPGLTIADLAARLRAHHRLATPDAIHAATALVCGATAMITNDAGFDRVPGLAALVLDRYL
jgi:predicted nucleic acid-binding protein